MDAPRNRIKVVEFREIPEDSWILMFGIMMDWCFLGISGLKTDADIDVVIKKIARM